MPLLRKAGDVPRRSLWQRIKDVALADVTVLARGGVKAGSIENLEELLLEADFGVPVTLRMVDEISRLALRGAVKTEAEFLAALRSSIAASLRTGTSDPRLNFSARKPTVIVDWRQWPGKTIHRQAQRDCAARASTWSCGGRHLPCRRDRSAAGLAAVSVRTSSASRW
jgi:hypothetical protein